MHNVEIALLVHLHRTVHLRDEDYLFWDITAGV